jgi:hypothetical protein
MRTSGRVVAASVVIVSVTVGAVGVAGADVSPKQQATNEKAEQLVSKFLDLLAEDTDPADLEAFLSDAFLLQRADGTSDDKAAYVEEPAIVESYEISDLQATRSGPVIVARYTVVVDSTVDGREQSSDPAPRLSVFVKGEDGWQLAAHSNFNSIAPETTPST